MYREKITELYKWKNQKTKIPILKTVSTKIEEKVKGILHVIKYAKMQAIIGKTINLKGLI